MSNQSNCSQSAPIQRQVMYLNWRNYELTFVPKAPVYLQETQRLERTAALVRLLNKAVFIRQSMRTLVKRSPSVLVFSSCSSRLPLLFCFLGHPWLSPHHPQQNQQCTSTQVVLLPPPVSCLLGLPFLFLLPVHSRCLAQRCSSLLPLPIPIFISACAKRPPRLSACLPARRCDALVAPLLPFSAASCSVFGHPWVSPTPLGSSLLLLPSVCLTRPA